MNGGLRPRPIGEGLPPARSAHASYQWSVRVVRAWFDVYARGVNPRDVEDRRARLDFELWEHADASDRLEPRALQGGLEILLRTALGVPQDLAWRRAALRGAALHVLPGPAPLLPVRSRPRVWLPIQPDHVFDQTNGTIAPDAVQAVPIQYGRPWSGPIGDIFGGRGD
jgi:hypothetical protein